MGAHRGPGACLWKYFNGDFDCDLDIDGSDCPCLQPTLAKQTVLTTARGALIMTATWTGVILQSLRQILAGLIVRRFRESFVP